MSDKYSSWGNFLSSYFGKHTTTEKKEQKVINTNYNSFEDAYFATAKKKVEEAEEQRQPHIVAEEQYERFVEEHIIEEPEQLINTEQDAIDAAIADGGMPVELPETTEMHLDDGPTPRPVEEPEFTKEELEAFKALNADKFIHETNDVPVSEIVDHYDVPNEVPVTDEPVETKVKKVKVSKPKAPKAPKKPGRPKTKK